MSDTILRNAWKHRLVLRDKTNALSVAPPGAARALAYWMKQPVSGTDFVQFCDPTNPTVCLNIQNGQLVLSAVQPGSLSAMWKLTAVDGTDFFHIQNRQTGGYLNNQKDDAVLAAGSVEPLWTSAMWALDGTLVDDARSVHLRFADSGVHAMYNEVTAIESHKGTYFSAIGFNGGYAGMQEIQDGSKIAIFSVWDNDNGKQKATYVASGPGVQRVDFHGEGDGQSAHMPFAWNLNQKVAFVVVAQPTPYGTDFSAYYKGGDYWDFLATIKRPGTQGTPDVMLNGLYSFVEDFLRNGDVEGVAAADRSPYQRHASKFSNPWVQGLNGKWSPISDATFTASIPLPPTPQKPIPQPPLRNINVIVSQDEIAFQLETGGPTVQSNPLDVTLHSPATPSASPDKSSNPPPISPAL